MKNKYPNTNRTEKILLISMIVFSVLTCVLSLVSNSFAYYLDLSSFAQSNPITLQELVTSYLKNLLSWTNGFLLNLSTGLIDATITFYLINLMLEHQRRRLEEGEEYERRKLQLLRQLRNSDLGIALQAAQELEAMGALVDGTLRNANLTGGNLKGALFQGANLQGSVLVRTILDDVDLEGANLEGANLEQASLMNARLVSANLRNTNFNEANLNYANLSWANLEGAEFIGESQLSKANMLWGATMPDGSRYDGRYDLEGDKEEAKLWGFNYLDKFSRSQFYNSRNLPK